MLLMSSMSVRACWRTLDEALTGWPLGAILAAIACQLWKRRRAVLSSSFVNGQLCDCKIRLNCSRTFSSQEVLDRHFTSCSKRPSDANHVLHCIEAPSAPGSLENTERGRVEIWRSWRVESGIENRLYPVTAVKKAAIITLGLLDSDLVVKARERDAK